MKIGDIGLVGKGTYLAKIIEIRGRGGYKVEFIHNGFKAWYYGPFKVVTEAGDFFKPYKGWVDTVECTVLWEDEKYALILPLSFSNGSPPYIVKRKNLRSEPPEFIYILKNHFAQLPLFRRSKVKDLTGRYIMIKGRVYEIGGIITDARVSDHIELKGTLLEEGEKI